MTDFAGLTFTFLKGKSKSFHLHSTCSRYSSTEPLCPFINLSAHFLSYLRISESFENLYNTLERCEKYLNIIGAQSEDIEPDMLLQIPNGQYDARAFTVYKLVDTLKSEADNARLAIKRQHLFNTNTDLLSNKEKTRILKGLMEIKDHCRTYVDCQSQKEMNDKIGNVIQSTRKLHSTFSDFFNKLKHSDDNNNNIYKAVSAAPNYVQVYSKHEYLDDNVLKRATVKTFVPSLCDRVREMAVRSGIWGGTCLKSLCQGGRKSHNVCKGVIAGKAEEHEETR